MASDSNNTVTLTAHCLCKANVFTTEVPESDLPLESITCHCTSCRHVTGALYSVDAHWPEPRQNVDTSKLKVYPFTKRIHLLFCGTCSTPIFYDHVQDANAKLGIFTGILTNDKVQPVEHRLAIFLGDTVDGGAMPWLSQPGTGVKRYVEDNEEGEPKLIEGEWPELSSLTGYEGKKDDKVGVHCRCRGVDFTLRQGDYEGKTEDELPPFIDARTRKIQAGLCACDSCRLSGGIDIWPWTYAELEYLSFSKSGNAFPKSTKELQALVDAKDPSVGTITYYTSSPGVQRYFCSTCSACVFYACDERTNFVDIAVGIIDASDGARAEGFLAWALGKGNISYRDNVKGGWREGLWQSVEQNCDEWIQKRGYPKLESLAVKWD